MTRRMRLTVELILTVAILSAILAMLAPVILR